MRTFVYLSLLAYFFKFLRQWNLGLSSGLDSLIIGIIGINSDDWQIIFFSDVVD